MTYGKKLHFWPLDEQSKNDSSMDLDWRSIAEKWPILLMIDGGVKQYKIVFDANMVLADMKFMCENPSRPTLLETLARRTIITPCAPSWLISELRCGSSMDEFLRSQPHLCAADLWKQWPKILEFLRIDSFYSYPLKSRLCGSPDLKDEPYISMAHDYKALGVLSRDKGCSGLNLRHLKRKDILPLQQLVDLLESVVGARLFVFGAPVAGTYGVAAGAHALYKQGAKLPEAAKYVVAGVAAATVIAFLVPKSRRYIIGQAKPVLSKIQPLLELYKDSAQQSFENELQAQQIITEIEKGRIDA